MPQVYQPLDVKNDLGEKEDDYEEGVGRVRNIQLVGFYEEVVCMAQDVQNEGADGDS